MKDYLILMDPGHNRVYYEQSQELSIAEMDICIKRLDAKVHARGKRSIAGINYLFFTTDHSLSSKDLLYISRLSFIFAIFELQGDLLKPIMKIPCFHLSSKMPGILKYPGKTNEQFTRMMINVAFLTSEFYDLNPLEDQVNLFDPLFGRGTTLYEGGVSGFNGYGIEIDKKSYLEACLFIEKFFQKERVKHSIHKGKSTAVDKSNAARINDYEYALTKEDFKIESKRRKIGLVNGDTKDSNFYFPKSHFHIIVGDLPYGIVHANVSSKGKKTKSRSSLDLLDLSLGSWFKNLKKGGSLVLSWNKNVLSRQDFEEKLLENGFFLPKEEIYMKFEHRVDNSIKRDIIISIKQ